MLKAQLACKNIVKAVSAGPKAKWVECVLTDSTEWETVCKVLGEGTVVGVVDEKLVEGMAMALKMGGPEVTSAIEEAAVVVKGYVGPSWPAESVLKLLSACLSKPEAATRTPRCLDLAIHMSTIIGKNHQKTIFETCCKDRTSYLNPMLEQGLTSLLEAVLFPSPADWMAYFKPKIEEDEVKQLVTLLRSGDHSWKDMVQHSKTEGGEKTRGVKKASMSLVFETVAACLTPDYFHLLLKSFQTSVLSLPATVEGKEIVVLRFFAVLLKITTTVARSPAALTAAVRTLVIELRCYHTQTDILYQNGLGFALLEFLSRQTIDSLSDNTVKDKRERRKTEANGLEIATRLLDLYHKLVEGDMREYCRTAMKEETKAGKTFLKNSFEKYAEMQSLDTVMEAVMKEQSVLPTKCDWLLELISKTLPKLIDFTSVANLVFEDTPAEQLPIVEHIAKGLKVDDISAATAATWVDNAMAVLLSQQIGDGSSKVKNPAKFVKILNLYLALQSVLDRASPFFLSNDIFKWSARSIQAFRLTSGPSSSSDANDVPILLLPQQDIVLTLGQVVSMCCNGDILDENNIVLRRSVVGLLHQRAMRLMKHKEIMSCWEDLNPEDATVMDKQLKVVCTKLFELSNGCLGLSSSGIPTEDLPYLAQYTSKSALKTFVCLLLEAARPVDKSPKMKNPTIAPISQDSPWTVQLDPYTPPPFLQSEAVWESPVLSKALLSSASDAMCPRSEPWVVERAASWLRCAPVSLLGDKVCDNNNL